MSVVGLDRQSVARMIDHTLLKPEATAADVVQLCVEALNLGTYAVCVSPSMVPVAVEALEHGDVLVACVAGFPSGAHQWKVKATEAALAVEQGADEVDVVIDLGLVKAGAWRALEQEVTLVRYEVPRGRVLKVIVESAALAPEELVEACKAAVAGGADFVKTSTGFHPAGGATVEAVRAMRATVGEQVGVKASGGIRTADQAVAMIEAGATRLGCSASAAILAGLAAG
jgi:deoxyribose-phosphate aldolase